MENNLKMTIHKTAWMFKKSFINNRNELILEPKNNICFSLNNVKNVNDFNCKVLAYCSRSCVKGASNYLQKYMGKNVNELLNTNFSYDDYELIYTYLGNDHTRQRLIDFVNNDMNIEWLRKEVQ